MRIKLKDLIDEDLNELEGYPRKDKKYWPVLRGDTFDSWRKKMVDLLDKTNITSDTRELWLDRIKKARSSKETSKVTKGIKGIVK